MAKKKKQERGSSVSSIDGGGSSNNYSNKTQVVKTEPTKTALPSTVPASKPTLSSYSDKDSVVSTPSPKPTPEHVPSIGPITTNVSSFGATKNNIISTATVQTQNAANKYEPPKSALSSTDRINPFDKNNINKTPIDSPTTKNIYTGLEKTEPTKFETNLEDLTKIRFEKQQGVQDRQTGRYVDMNVTTKTSFDTTINKFSAAPVTFVSEKPEIKPTTSENKFARTNSSDADIIFGSKSNMEKYKDKYGGSRGSLKKEPSDTDVLYGSSRQSFDRSAAYSSSMSSDSDFIFGPKRDDNNTFEKSLSLSSDKDGDFASDSRVTSRTLYGGIQNAAFKDYDSPVQKPSSSSSSKKWTTGDDDYDLK